MSTAPERVNESVLLAFGGITDEKGQKSEPVIGYTYSTLVSNDVLPQVVKGVRAIRRTADLLSKRNQELGKMLTDIADDYDLVIVSTRSMGGKFLERITTHNVRATIKGDEDGKAGFKQQLAQMFGQGGAGGGGLV
jgi:hypothetical protein